MMSATNATTQDDRTVVCLLDGARGIYVPQAFAELFDRNDWGLSDKQYDESWNTLLSGPDAELYWESWEEIHDAARYTKNGHTWHLSQDGDLFAFRDDHDHDGDDG